MMIHTYIFDCCHLDRGHSTHSLYMWGRVALVLKLPPTSRSLTNHNAKVSRPDRVGSAGCSTSLIYFSHAQELVLPTGKF